MKKNRRQVVARVVKGLGLILILLDVAAYFALLRPLQNLVVSEELSYTGARRRIRDAQARIDRLEKFQEALPTAGDRIEAFKRDHLPPRRRGFSQAARLLRRVTEQSGIQLTNVAYRLDPSRSEPLERLGIEVNVQGPFSGLMKFAHALETASDFIVIREFAFGPGDGGALALHLATDLYLQP